MGPEELKRLTSALLSVLVAIAIATFFLMIIVPGLRSSLVPEPHTNPAGNLGRTGWLDPTDYPAIKAYTVPPVDPQVLITGNADLLKQGTTLYEQNCIQCHGPAGRGDGPAATTLVTPPRNFSRADGWKNGPNLLGIFTTLEKGIPGTGMASFDYLRIADRMALCHKVQTFAEFKRPPEDPSTLGDLSKRLARSAEQIPAQIPVRMALAALSRESPTIHVPFLDRNDSENRAAFIWKRIVTDPDRATLSLVQSNDWRPGANALAQAVTIGSPGNGFAPSSATLTSDDWRTLHEFLIHATLTRK